MDNGRFLVGAFALIFDEQDRVLLSHRRDMDLWNLPGGGAFAGEMPTEAVLREVSEETGLEVAIDRLVGVYGKVGQNELVFAFACRITGGTLRLSEEADAHRYFALDEIPRNTSPKQVERVRDALARSGAPVFRRQAGPSSREWLAGLRQG